MAEVKLTDSDKFTLIHHWENTRWELIKCYTLSQLRYMEWKWVKYLRNHVKILPVRVDVWNKACLYKKGISPTPYSVKYIRVDEVEAMLTKLTWKKAHIIYD